MHKQVTCIDILRISNKLNIPISELTDDDIKTNIKENELTDDDIKTNIKENKLTDIKNDEIIPENNVDDNLNKKYMISMTFNFLKYLSR